MKFKESNLITICKTHGIVYEIIIRDHNFPARQALVECKCYEFDSSLEAKKEGYECKSQECKNKFECIFNKTTQEEILKLKRPILKALHRNGQKIYGCIHYNWNGDPLNEEQ